MKLFKQTIAPLSGLALLALASSASAVTAHIEEAANGNPIDLAGVNALVADGTAVGAGETLLTGTLDINGGTPDLLIDEDVFTFTLDAGAFTADITSFGAGLGQPADPAMTLFEWDGVSWRARAATDPNINDVNLSWNAPATALYALIINQFGNDPKSAGADFYSPLNLGLPWNNMAGVAGSGSSFDYEITISGVDVTAVVVSEVPVPAAAWLFGSGLIGMVGVARRKA